MFKFIHAADIHLDSPLLNLSHYDGAPVEGLRVATREAFDNMVQLAIDEQVRFVLIAGDLYDKDSPNFHTPIHVRSKMRELHEHGIGVYLIQGNHDATTEAKRAFALSMPPNVHVLSTKRAETFLLEDIQVAIHGQGFAKRAIDDDLSHNYPPALPGYFNIGLLHTNFGGNPSHDNYAPSSRGGLTSKNYHYWALGHIHKRNTSIGPNPHIIYPGNTQGRHIREQGAKGCVMVTVSHDHRASVSFRPTDVWRWQQCEVDASACETPHELLEAARGAIDGVVTTLEDRCLAARLKLVGASPAHAAWLSHAEHWTERLRITMLDHFEDRVWIEKVECRTQPFLQGVAPQADDAWGDLIAAIHELVPGREIIRAVESDLRKVLGSLPHDARLAATAIDLDDDRQVEELVAEAKKLVIAELLDPGDAA